MAGAIKEVGRCACGCGELTKIAHRNGRGYRKGEPLRYIHGHHQRGRRYVILDPPNPGGVCLCGCLEKAPIARKTCRTTGHVAGHPMRFIRGHCGRVRTRDHVDTSMWRAEDRGYETPCWILQKTLQPNGYGQIEVGGVRVGAHRFSYEQYVGPIPDGLQIDHLCNQRACINPDHLEPVTASENQLRAVARRKLLEGRRSS